MTSWDIAYFTNRMGLYVSWICETGLQAQIYFGPVLIEFLTHYRKIIFQCPRCSSCSPICMSTSSCLPRITVKASMVFPSPPCRITVKDKNYFGPKTMKSDLGNLWLGLSEASVFSLLFPCMTNQEWLSLF